MKKPERLLPWFILKDTPGIGHLIIRRLVDRFQTPEAVFSAPETQLLEVEGMSRRLVQALWRQRRTNTNIFLKELEAAFQKGFRIIVYTDGDYPAVLRRIPDPPPLLYVLGDFDPTQPAVAVVGSRKATPYGVSATKSLCRDLSAAGILVVSGMALGIDTAAHQGALEAGGPTVAVLGCGLDRVYPPQNTGLYYDISQNGAVISEFSLATKPDAHHFPMRNRIISGMSLGVVVVEATRRSGSLITARLALEQNREVFAVPGSIRSFASRGTHGLIKQGAKLVESVEDILEELPLVKTLPAKEETEPENSPGFTDEETRVAAALTAYPVTADEIIQQLDITAARLMASLFSLEIKGIVCQFPGNRFALSHHVEPISAQCPSRDSEKEPDNMKPPRMKTK